MPASAPLAHRPPLVVVANRLPVHYDESEGSWRQSPGGLVSALRPVAAARHGSWVGWNDGAGDPPRTGLRLEAIHLSKAEVDGYYLGYANRTLWPAMHGLQSFIEHEPHWWEAYRRVNERFAERTAGCAAPGATVWIHDYHLLLAPRFLAERRPDVRIGVFLHTPVPDPATACLVPEWDALAHGLRAAALIGTQRVADAERLKRSLATATQSGPRVVAHPISIDARQVRELRHDPVATAVAERVRRTIARGRPLLVGVDRMDYTKGLPERLHAFADVLALRRRRSEPDVALVQVASPSRTAVPAYAELRRQVRGLVADINDRFESPAGPVVHLIEESVPFRRVMGYFLAADVALVTPLCDGMNLVAKEFATARAGDDVALVLSRTAGAADELGENAVLVDPTDPVDLAGGIEQALQRRGMSGRLDSARLAERIERHDVHAWARDFLGDIEGDPEPALAGSTRATVPSSRPHRHDETGLNMRHPGNPSAMEQTTTNNIPSMTCTSDSRPTPHRITERGASGVYVSGGALLLAIVVLLLIIAL
ncbi:MAG: trehalose-6-phosphate synthase [Acidimicrobiales bacterium]|nr:trehalose-6-phosphate synthase [Acidimicrobiales bacterium]